MNKIMHIWNNNRKKIIFGVLAIAFVIILIQVLNQLAKVDNQKSNNQKENTQGLPVQSIITSEKVNTEVTKSNVQIIEEFIQKCNNKDVTGAYNLLTDECKQKVFGTKEEFETNYYNTIFTEKKGYSIDNYLNSKNSYTYLVKFYSDSLSTGVIRNSPVYQDYITVDKKSKDIKLNVYGYIKTEQIQKKTEKNGITISVVSKDIYEDYEKYEIKIENKTDKKILINTNKKVSSLYIENIDGAKFESYITQIANSLLIIDSNMTRSYNIKFHKTYNPSVTIKSVNFDDIVGDYEKYLSSQENLKDRISIKVEI